MPPNPAYPDSRTIRAWRLLLVGLSVVFTVAAVISLSEAAQALLLAVVFSALAAVCLLLAWRLPDAALARWGAWLSGFGT